MSKKLFFSFKKILSIAYFVDILLVNMELNFSCRLTLLCVSFWYSRRPTSPFLRTTTFNRRRTAYLGCLHLVNDNVKKSVAEIRCHTLFCRYIGGAAGGTVRWNQFIL